MVSLMYLLPMMLGRTFDLNKYTVGVDIFSSEDLKTKIQVIESPYTAYKLTPVYTEFDAEYLREEDYALSLKIKAGLMDVKGPTAYIASVVRSVNSIDVIYRLEIQTAIKTTYADPIPGWSTMDRQKLGTHYVNSMTYGADLVACIRFQGSTTQDLEYLRKSTVGNNILDEGRLEKLVDELKGKATVEISYYSRLPLDGVPRTFDGVRSLKNNLSHYMLKENNGLGVPIRMELAKLDMPNNAFDEKKYLEMQVQLKFFEEDLNDLITAESNVQFWLQRSPGPVNEQQRKQFSEFRERLDSVRGLYNQTIADLDYRNGPQQLERAKQAYEDGLNGGRSFFKLFRSIDGVADWFWNH